MPLDGFSLSFVDAIAVGATLSATDPVTILAIFNVYKVEPKLYTVIFGESILNDAIAIVLFETAQRYKPGSAAGSLTVLSLFEAIGIFLLVFFGSMVIGVVVGIATALGLKYTHIRRQPKIESCVIVLVAYASYFFSNGVHMSGSSLIDLLINQCDLLADLSVQVLCRFFSAESHSSIMLITICHEERNLPQNTFSK